MAISFNNGSNPTAVSFNGNASVTAVNFNGSQVWTKPAAGWKNAWSGEVYLFDMDEIEGLAQEWGGDYEFTHEFTGISVPDLSQYTVQVDAEFYTFVFPDPVELPDPNNAVAGDYLAAPKNSSSEVTNLPWYAGGLMYGTLDPIVQNGSSVTITAHSLVQYLWGSMLFGGFVIKNIWYYDK